MAFVHPDVMRTGSYVTRLSDGRAVGFSGVLKLESDHLSIQPALFPRSNEWVQTSIVLYTNVQNLAL